ncbi:MAG: GNAT family N-acetyltransferase, partial [Pseudomonadota bacterium]
MVDRIETARLVLRPYEAADIPSVIRLLGDFEISKWLAKIPHPFTEADLRLNNSDGTSRWPDTAAITCDGVFIGAISAMPDHFGYWLDPAYHGRGLATEAGRAMADDLFARRGADHILAGYFDGNPASRRVLEKLGFREKERYPFWCEARQRRA